jgi:predicted amidohydrolase YtcJ
MELYAKVMEAGTASTFPVSAAMLPYDSNTGDFAATVDIAVRARKLFGDNPLLTVAALKTFVDGSPQGYTAFFDSHYRRWFDPFTDSSLFAQPYRGLGDIDGSRLRGRLVESHKAGFPMVIHQIGDAATQLAVDAIVATRNTPPPKGTRDVMLHIAFMTPAQLDAVSQVDTAVLSVMPANVYFYGLPECQQVVGPERILNSYPAKEAIEKTGRVTLHTDSPVNPPYPLFAMWAAVTRNVQQPAWYPNRNPSECPPVAVNAGTAPGDQRISVEQAVRGYTVDAAYQYGMDNVRGTLEVGKIADMVLLSENPLGEETVKNPDNLKNIRVLGTVRYGTSFPNPDADQPPIWPS